MESFQYGSKRLQLPAFLVQLVFTADAEIVEPDVFAVLMVTCHDRNAHSDVTCMHAVCGVKSPQIR